jgi:class 3 adenylate cyclase
VRTALALVRGVAALDLQLRAGVHTGEVEIRANGDITGFAVHVASRIAALAGPGEVTVSRTVDELVRGAGLSARDLGDHELRGVDGTWRLVALSEPPAPS